jgi:hypothetical protein
MLQTEAQQGFDLDHGGLVTGDLLQTATWEIETMEDQTELLPTLEVAVRERPDLFFCLLSSLRSLREALEAMEQQHIAEGLLPSTSELSRLDSMPECTF